MKHTLYLDLDGVLADFNVQAQKLINATDAERNDAERSGRWKRELWGQLKRTPNFYRHLPLTKFANDLVELATRFQNELGWNVEILTAIPRHNDVPEAFQDKVEWAQEHFPQFRVRFGPYSHDKHQHARPGDILVDDRYSNCTEWTQAGGTAVQVKTRNPEPALQQLTAILNQQLAQSLT